MNLYEIATAVAEELGTELEAYITIDGEVGFRQPDARGQIDIDGDVIAIIDLKFWDDVLADWGVNSISEMDSDTKEDFIATVIIPLVEQKIEENWPLETSAKEIARGIVETVGNSPTNDDFIAVVRGKKVIVRNVEFEESDLDETGQDFTDEAYLRLIQKALYEGRVEFEGQ